VLPPTPERKITRWRSPYSFTALVPVGSDSIDAIRQKIIEEIPGIADGIANLEGLHSFRILLVPDPEDDAQGAQLLLNAVHDEGVSDFLWDLEAAVGPALSRLYEPVSASLKDGQSVRSWLAAHRQREATVHIGLVGRTVEDIRREQRLREVLQVLIDEGRAAGWTHSTPAETIRVSLRDRVLALRDVGLPLGPRPRLSLGAKISKAVSWLGALANPTSGLLASDVLKWVGQKPAMIRWSLRVLLVPWGLYTIVPTCLWLAAVRILELTEPDEPTPKPDPQALLELMEDEDEHLMNQLTMCLPVRGSWIRRWMLHRVFVGAQHGANHLWNQGLLEGIGTIHFARFLHTHGRSRMMFLSDYDGSWDRYLTDFLTLGDRAVVPIWASCRGCPKTRWMFGTTAGFAPRFLDLTRRYQAPAPLWYSAVPDLSVNNMLNNARVREGLFLASMDEAQAREWCAWL
jgi:hypothetical protein